MTGATALTPLPSQVDRDHEAAQAPAGAHRRGGDRPPPDDTVNRAPTAVHRLEALLAPGVVHALQDLVDERVRAELGSNAARGAGLARRWLTIPEAALALGCSPDAIRMRVARGRLEHRRQGRRVYISAAAINDLR